MGMVASIENPYPRKINLVENSNKKTENSQGKAGVVHTDSLTVYRGRPAKPQNRSRVRDGFPEVIKLVKNPQPSFYPNNYYAASDRRSMLLHDDTVRNRAGDTIMYTEPGLAGQRKMILFDPHSVRAPKKLVMYDQNLYPNPKQRIMNYYDQSMRDSNPVPNMNALANVQNMHHLSSSGRLNNDVYYNNYPQGYVDRRLYKEPLTDSIRDSQKLVSDPLKGVDSPSSSKTSLITVSSTPFRRSSDSAILTTRELEVETIERFQDSSGKIYKIVKPVGERTRVIYSKSENYERLLIVESPGEGNYIISKAEGFKSVHNGGQLIPRKPVVEDSLPPSSKSQVDLEESQLRIEESQPTTEEPQPTAEESQPTTEEPQPTAEELRPATEEPQPTIENPQPTIEESLRTLEEPLPTSGKQNQIPKEEDQVIEAASNTEETTDQVIKQELDEAKSADEITSLFVATSNQANPKINFKEVDYRDNKSMKLTMNLVKNPLMS